MGKIDRVLEEMSQMKRMVSTDDSAQQQSLDMLIADFNKLKENLFGVQSAWTKLVSNCITPAEQQELAKTKLTNVVEPAAKAAAAKAGTVKKQPPPELSPQQNGPRQI